MKELLKNKLKPDAFSVISGNDDNHRMYGTVYFYKTPFGGTLVEAEVDGLPVNPDNPVSFYGFHIHENGNCTPPFDQTGGHFNPSSAPHPDHAGDLVPLLGNYGYAYLVFYTERFNVDDITGRSVVIHENPDDFTTQPSGNSGTKIGCGVIQGPDALQITDTEKKP